MIFRPAIALLAVFTAPPAMAADYAFAALDDGVIARETLGGQDAAALYEAGSIGKFACTLATLRLADQGMLSLDDTLGARLARFAGTPIADVTVRQVLASRSGLADGLMPAFRSDPQTVLGTVGAANALAAFGSAPLAFEPGSRWSYDLVNWIAVQAVLEGVTGRPVAETLRAEVLEPAGMGQSRIFAGRIESGAAIPLSEAPPLPGFLTCAGGLATTPTDLLALARFPHKGGLSAAMLAELVTIHTAEEGYTLGGRYTAQRMGGEQRLVSWQSGSNGAYKSLVTYDPVSDTGFAAMTAAGDTAEIDAARQDWLDRAAR